MLRTAWSLARGALPAVAVATLIPMVLFWTALKAGSVDWAIGASVLYAYGASAYQMVRRRRVSGMLLVTMFMATLKALAALLSGQPAVYFAIPAVETAGFGLMFLVTMFTSEPLIVRLARDLVPHLVDHFTQRQALVRTLSLVWTATYLASGITTITLLATLPFPLFLGAHTVTGYFWTGSGLLSTVIICRLRASEVFADAAPPLNSSGETSGAPAALG